MITIKQNAVLRHDGIRYQATGEYRAPKTNEVYLKGQGGLNMATHRMYESRLIYIPDTSGLTDETIQNFEKATVKKFVKSGFVTMNSDGTFFWHKNKPKYHDSCGEWYSSSRNSGESSKLSTGYSSHRQPPIYEEDENEPVLLWQEVKYIDASKMLFKI